MRTILLTFFHLLFFSCVSGQVTFSNIDSKLKTVEDKNGTALYCTDSSFSIKFRLTQKSIKLQGNFAIVDSQIIQITPLDVSGLKKGLADLSALEQKELLSNYSKYEMDYFKKELSVEIIDPKNQWVVTNSKNWLVWYFKVGGVPTNVDKKIEFQLFASTIIGGKVLTINAPVLSVNEVAKSGAIVNQMMESLTDNNKK
jgi:hypothetical protein